MVTFAISYYDYYSLLLQIYGKIGAYGNTMNLQEAIVPAIFLSLLRGETNFW
jgi:hypothetical protein